MTVGAAPWGRPAECQGNFAGRAARRLQFEPNRGQADPSVSFVAHGCGYHVSLTPTETILALRSSGGEIAQRGDKKKAGAGVLRMQLVGANPHSRATGLEALPGRAHYLRGSDARTWRTDIPTYAKVEHPDFGARAARGEVGDELALVHQILQQRHVVVR